jgi:nicotinamidase-related amidase
MSTLDLRVWYFQDSTPEGVPCREENFVRREVTMPLPVEQTAFLLIDVWNNHFIESWAERAREVTVRVIVPALAAARQAGLTIIHAPGIREAVHYPQLARHTPPAPEPEPNWPPAEFRRREGAYAIYRGPRHQPPGIGFRWNKVIPHLRISPAIEVRDDDTVLGTGQQLHEFCGRHGILHLIVVGFATNWCVMGKDYGIRAMKARGYNFIPCQFSGVGRHSRL